jgi:hypothetical protein
MPVGGTAKGSDGIGMTEDGPRDQPSMMPLD